MAVIGGFRSDLLITRKTDGNFGNVFADVLFSKVAYQRKRWYDKGPRKSVKACAIMPISIMGSKL